MTTYYTKSHEWIRLDGEEATVGITAHASEELGELVFVEARDEGTDVAAGDAAAVVESGPWRLHAARADLESGRQRGALPR